MPAGLLSFATMSIRKSLTYTLCLVAIALPASDIHAQDEFSSLEERMTGEEFDRAGLDKLSRQELQFLNEWLRSRSVAEYERPPGFSSGAIDASEDRRGLPETSSKSEIHTRIKGVFDGWNGPTRYEMDNGMVWETVGSGRYQVPATENPPVVISPSLFMGWEMRVGDYNRRVQVKRIK